MKPELIALAVSVVSLIVAAISLGWNIYRDVLLKPRVGVRLAVVRLVARGQSVSPQHVSVSGTNFGPGEVVISMIHGLSSSFWKRLLRQGQRFVVLPPDPNSVGGTVPARLREGEAVDLLLPYDRDCILGKEFTHLGLRDSFGRDHWAPRKDVASAKEQYAKDFAAKVV